MSLRVSILGIGNMGKNHLRVLSILRGVTIVKIFDFNEEALKLLSEEYDVSYTTNAEEALEGVDAAIIVTPTSTHYEYFKLCVGKVNNIFIEKPLAESYVQAQEIEVLAKENNIFVQCGFIERFNPVVIELKKILKDSTVIHSDFFRTNRLSNRITDVDVVVDLMIHDIDLALYLNGPIKDIVAFGSKENGLIAFASASLIHENGSLSRIIASRMTEKKMRSIQVTTSDSFIDAELLRKELQVHRQSSISKNENDSYIVSSLEQQIEVGPQEALLAEVQAFLNVCSGDNSEQVPDLYAGVESLRICELIMRSIENQ